MFATQLHLDMRFETINSKSDLIGGIATGLCAIHCAATPLLFVAQACSVSGCCDDSPAWWSSIDYLFIGITFFAIYWSAKNTSKHWIKYALYTNWLLLTLIILNEKAQILALSDTWKYIMAFSLIALHFYNRKFCQCSNDECIDANSCQKAASTSKI